MSYKIRDTKGKIQNTMYHKQIKIFAILLTFFLFAFLLRLAQMQLLSNSFYRDKITKLRLQKSHSRQFKTVRGKILDRNGKVLAVDEPQFQLYINYGLTCFMDDRVRQGNLLKAADKKDDTGASAAKAQKKLDDGLADLNQIISKCAQLGGVKPTEVKTEIQKINDFIWKQRTFQAWRDNFPNSEVFENYKNIISIPDYVATADFEKKEPNSVERLRLINKVDIAEMHKNWPLVELKTDDDIFTAQLEFSDIDGVQILAKGQRSYPFGSAAAQTIGWVGPATQQADRQLFADDKLSRYLDDEVCGREDGVEYACETILRGKRGKIVYDIDRELIDETKAQLGKDVSLTLDIELQQKIEKYLTDCKVNPNCRAPTAAVVIDVASGDILALVSIPVFDLNHIRKDYASVANDPNEPLRNRAINKQYPPGSAIKPLILIAGLESGKITADEIIHCPAQKAPKGWPNCWIYNKYHWTGHDDMWQNNARNAIKGSCNIYFSQLADRIEPLVLQQWLSAFGYGHVSSLVARDSSLVQAGDGDEARDLRQAAGQISTISAQSTNPARSTPAIAGSATAGFEQSFDKLRTVSNVEPLPPINRSERRYFGIGQGNLRATPLQAANAMAAIARGGIYKSPRLFLTPDATRDEGRETRDEKVLGISAETLSVVRDGMYAVVNEPDGTAYREFAYAGLDEQGVKAYGKTGSTEEPANAWFSGFAEDRKGRKLAIAVVVEGGQHGSSDAAPLARDIIQFCIEAGYIGNR
jgi:penicillin-binding protein 2